MIGLVFARSSAQTSRVMMYSASLPSVLMNSVSVKPALFARIMSGENPSSLYVFIDRIASAVYDDCITRFGFAALSDCTSEVSCVVFAGYEICLTRLYL